MIAIGSDHAAFNFKKKIIEYLDKNGYEYIDCGAFDPDVPSDYPDYAAKVCEKIQAKDCDKGILICGTGIGMSITANKFDGIRCALCGDTFSARATREHNNANVLALGERVIGMGLALDIVDTFLTTEFSNVQRHINRIDKITKIELNQKK